MIVILRFFFIFTLTSICAKGINVIHAQTTINFSYTGSAQFWTVPPCVTSITVVAAGAKGGGASGGNGARITATFAVTPGQVIQINVGGLGTVGNASGGWNGGGTGRASSNSTWHSGGGGGASDVRNTPYALNNRIIVGGGGGGRGGGSQLVAGGAANCNNGAAGTSPFGVGGGGGTQTNGGVGGPPWTMSGTAGTAGVIGIGGIGGIDNCFNVAPGGGGGGGFYGGGAGGSDCFSSTPHGGGSGGAGSSLVPGGGTCLANNNNGNGYVNITYIENTINMVVTNTGAYCQGATVQLNSSGGGTSYSWTGPNGFTSNIQNPTIPYSMPAMSGTYTVTAVINGCAHTGSTNVIVNTAVTPTFAQSGPFCSGASIPALPTTSQNGITGSWSPAINNTTTGTYTFTPTAGQCATTATLTITINPNITPTFAAVGPYCSGGAIPALPTTSQNGFTGVWSPAINNLATSTYTFTPTVGQCATSTTLTITINPNITPTFAAVGPYCSGAVIPALPTTSQNGYTGTWAPAINNTATTTYTFTPTVGQCATSTTLTITINPNITPTFAAVGPYCSGAVIPALPTTSQNGFTGAWSPAVNNLATSTYTFAPTVGQCATSATLTITINPNITPTFAAVGPYCSGAVIPALPTTSQNGITGSWSPAINNTATTTYTFTPTLGLCAISVQMIIVINPNVTPSFAAVGPYCSGAPIPALPTTSLDGITGIWSPSINNATTTTYTFTPTLGQCASTQSITIIVTPNVTPIFTVLGPYCSGSTIPALPSTSQNGIPGSWSPAINNTATTTYTFSPSSGQCATAVTMTITIAANVTPTFASVGPYCSGATIPALPTISQNAFTGTWTPAINNTATTTYTFTPTAGQCATTASTTISINPNITPTFAAAGPYCSGAAVPALPTTSQNGYMGTWSPAINNTTTTIYTFTPTAGQCATTTTLNITINPQITPSFAPMGPYCSGAAVPALPITSQNGYVGTWSPAINNTATTIYTFTPTAGQCATTTTLSITINPQITPSFAAVGPYCSGATIPVLPATSQNGYNGSWSPAINNTATTTYTFTPTIGQCATTTSLTITINPNILPTFSAVGPYCSGAAIAALPTSSQNNYLGTWYPLINNTNTTIYTFSPNAGLCATTATLSITINPNITPTFAAVGPYCSGGTIPALSTTSQNGLTGSWAPAINNNATTTYTFTPTSGLCATTNTATVVVNNPSQSTTNNSVCANTLPFVWNGMSLSTPGQHQAFFVNSEGCDSIALLNLIVYPVLTSTTNVVICQNQAPYYWNGLYLSSSGTNTLTLASSLGCDSIATLNLTVNPMPQISFTANYESGCTPLNVAFTSNVNSQNSTCQWNFGNGIVSNNCGTITSTYNSFGCYDVTLQVTSINGCITTLTQDDIVCVNPQPTAAFNVYPNALTNMDPTAYFTNTSSGHTTQLWDFGDGTGNSTESNPSYTYSEDDGYYYVTLVVANNHGCTDTTVQLVTVDNEPIYYVPNTFTPDGDQFNQTFKPVFTSGFDIFNYNLLIFNRWGEIIFESNNAEIGWDGTFGGMNSPDGTYIWQIQFKELNKDKHILFRGHFHLLR